MKTRTIIFWVVVFTIALGVYTSATAQEKHTSIMLGYKSIELGYTYTDEETELIFGSSISGVDANTAEKRCNRNDKGKHHEFNGSVVFAWFLNAGAKFDRLNIIGKIGGSYVSQQINSEPTKDLFLALGLTASYSVNERYSIIGSYDSVNSVQAGIMIKL